MIFLTLLIPTFSYNYHFYKTREQVLLQIHPMLGNSKSQFTSKEQSRVLTPPKNKPWNKYFQIADLFREVTPGDRNGGQKMMVKQWRREVCEVRVLSLATTMQWGSGSLSCQQANSPPQIPQLLPATFQFCPHCSHACLLTFRICLISHKDTKKKKN